MSCFYKIPSEEKKEIRIILVGITGKGKSWTQRTILGDKTPDDELADSKCQMKTKDCDDGYRVVVADTPGLFSLSGNEEALEGIKTSIKLLDPGPHVFLYVMDVQVFTQQYPTALKLIYDTFGKNTVKYTMVLFTKKDVLGEKTIEKFIEEEGKLRDFIHQCQGRYHALNNRDESPEQVNDLLQKIRAMIDKNQGSYYTHKMLQEAEKALKKQTPEEYAAAQKVIHKAGLAGTAVGCVVGYFVGGGELTSSIGAAVGALACGILAMASSGLVIKIKKLISECKSS